EKLEATKGSAAKTVNGLVVVANDDDVAALRGEQVQQFELRNVSVLKFVHENVFVALLELAPPLRVVLQELHCLRDQAVQGHGAFFPQDLFACPVGAGNFLLQRHLFSPLFVGI